MSSVQLRKMIILTLFLLKAVDAAFGVDSNVTISKFIDRDPEVCQVSSIHTSF
jgi:hypothetical protein